MDSPVELSNLEPTPCAPCNLDAAKSTPRKHERPRFHGRPIAIDLNDPCPPRPVKASKNYRPRYRPTHHGRPRTQADVPTSRASRLLPERRELPDDALFSADFMQPYLDLTPRPKVRLVGSHATAVRAQPRSGHRRGTDRSHSKAKVDSTPTRKKN